MSATPVPGSQLVRTINKRAGDGRGLGEKRKVLTESLEARFNYFPAVHIAVFLILSVPWRLAAKNYGLKELKQSFGSINYTMLLHVQFSLPQQERTGFFSILLPHYRHVPEAL